MQIERSHANKQECRKKVFFLSFDEFHHLIYGNSAVPMNRTMRSFSTLCCHIAIFSQRYLKQGRM
jgi:hypothetical protein